MELENEQEALIKTYLRDVEVQMDLSIPPDDRTAYLDRLRFRIDQELKAGPEGQSGIAAVQAVLDRLGPPSAQAAKVTPTARPTSGLQLDTRHAVWLGVCSGIANWLGMERIYIRGLAVLVGIIPPFALLVYLGFYVFMYSTAPANTVPRIDYTRVIKYLVLAVAGVMILHYLAYYTLAGLEYGHVRILNRDLPELGEWGWILGDLDSMFYWALFCAVPLALLSALPMANGWSYSLKRLSQAVVALYGVGLAFGIASYLAGLILNYVEQFSDGGSIF